MNTYPEMNEKIVGLLELSDEPMYLYAAQRIKELEQQVAQHPVPDASQPAGNDAAIKNLPFYGWKKDGMKENPDDVPMDDVFILREDVLKVISQTA